jgi:hypothetical protein
MKSRIIGIGISLTFVEEHKTICGAKKGFAYIKSQGVPPIYNFVSRIETTILKSLS